MSSESMPSSLPNTAALRCVAMEKHKADPRARFTRREITLIGYSLFLDTGTNRHPVITELGLIAEEARDGKYMAIAAMLDPNGPGALALVPVCNIAKVLLGILPESFILDRIPADKHYLLEELER